MPEPTVEEVEDKTTVSEAFRLYVDEIAFDEQCNKSPKQRDNWEKTKQTSVNYFTEVISAHGGDLTRRCVVLSDLMDGANASG